MRFPIVSAVWSGEVVELLQLGQFGVKVDIARVAEKLALPIPKYRQVLLTSPDAAA